jgi:hypothetical protein
MAFRAKELMQRFLPRLAKRTVLGKETPLSGDAAA